MIIKEIDIVNLIEAIASILWPLSFIGILYFFKDSLKNIIQSASSRKFTLKVAGNELTMSEITEQQITLISDLQKKVSKLEADIETNQDGNNTTTKIKLSNPDQQVKNILWVDDLPKNNSFITASLEEVGISVKAALSTSEAMKLYKTGRFDQIISDMGRPEGKEAGIDLTRKIREIDSDIPIHIFCGGWAAKNMKAKVLKAGASTITNSGTELIKNLNIRDNG